MRVAYLTAGAAGMYCGSCMRDNSLVRVLRDMGCDVVLVPTFTPITTDEEDASLDMVFLGGVNVYLEQRFPIFRGLPHWARRALDRPGLLRLISRLALQTRRSGDGDLAISLLRGEHGNQRSEIEDLVTWLADDLRPDLVNLTNLLISGFVPSLRRRHDVPVLVTLQGDDVFLDSLPAGERAGVLAELRRVARSIDGFVVFTDFYRDHMAGLLEIPPERFHRVPVGLADPEAFAPRAPAPGDRPPTVGYLARICPEKGFHLLVEAFIRLARMPGMNDARLHAAGWLGATDRPYYETQLRRLDEAGLTDAFRYVQLDDRAAKIDFLHGLDVFSVPTTYHEPKGLFVLEALAAGLPAVLPDHGCFPELARETGGIRLVPPGNVPALADALHALLENGAERRKLGDEGREHVCRSMHAGVAAEATLAVWHRFGGR